MKISKSVNQKQSEQKCWICRQELVIQKEPVVSVSLSNGSKAKAHELCIEGLKLLLEHVDYEPSVITESNIFVRKIKGEWILIHRDFPNQYLPVLIFFSINGEDPKSTQDLTSWLKVNHLKLSNPSLIVKRLRKKGALAVIVGEDGVMRHFLTEKGTELLKQHKEWES